LHALKLQRLLDERALLKKYRKEILELRKKLVSSQRSNTKSDLSSSSSSSSSTPTQSTSSSPTPADDSSDLSQKLQEQEVIREALEEKIKTLTKLILHSSDQQAEAATGQPEKLSPRLNQLKQASAKRRQAQRAASIIVSTSVEPDDAAGEVIKQFQDKIIELEQSKKTIEVLKQEITTKDERLVLLSQTVDLLQQNIVTLKKNITEKDSQLSSTHEQLILLSKQLGSPILKPDNKVDADSTLKQDLVEKDLEIEGLKADNKLLMTEINEKKQHLEQFVTVAETLEKNFKAAEAENKLLKSKLKGR